jgi:superoxide dismutase, Fe-Mn family
MIYRIAPLFCRPWTLNNMSPRLIESHYEHNYGAVLNRHAWKVIKSPVKLFA